MNEKSLKILNSAIFQQKIGERQVNAKRNPQTKRTCERHTKKTNNNPL